MCGQECDGGGATVVFVGGKASGERLVEGQKKKKRQKQGDAGNLL